MDIAKKVQRNANEKELNVEIKSKENPRPESEKHYCNADHDKLKKLGFKRTREIDDEIKIRIEDLLHYKDRIGERKDVIMKNIKWQKSR
ncbi:hypothetical protein [Nitrosopumilus piranensis]|uniref:Epimerase n=1 Tax=Nitrosopumilus piranensis TaxID=1582439 RepID=A0A0C5BX97_9ARCH|nr:hypothetical protein [Nitrosopumilus piranensis]AJM91545.1 Epimerase [Nitrosopumilus piranensis]